jgi:hypothetical protein
VPIWYGLAILENATRTNKKERARAYHGARRFVKRWRNIAQHLAPIP